MSNMFLTKEIAILEEFTNELDTKFTGSQIAKNKSLNQKTTATTLLQLEKQHILKSTTQGRNKLYTFNYDNKELVLPIICAVEQIRTFTFFTRHPYIKAIISEIKPYIKGTGIIFGSYAKGIEKEDSDLDLYILGEVNENKIQEISKMYNKVIDLKIYDRKTHDFLTQEVIKNHIFIKNTEQFVEKMINEKTNMVS